MHVTVQEGGSLPKYERCSSCCDKFHCPFCSTEFYKPAAASRLKKHLQFHFNRAVRHKGYTIHRCGLGCRAQLHYHCIYCQSMLLRREDFDKHLIVCKAKQLTSVSLSEARPANAKRRPSSSKGRPASPEAHPSSSESSPSSSEASPPSPVGHPTNPKGRTSSSEALPSSSEALPSSSEGRLSSSGALLSSEESTDPGTHSPTRKIRVRPVIREKCPMCHILMNKRNIMKHIDRKHTSPELSDSCKHHLRSECIDEANGIYSVQKTFHGHSVPLHVQNKAQGENHLVLCELQDCQRNMDLAWRSGMGSYRCVHLRSVARCTNSAKSTMLREDSLENMVQSQWLGYETRESCLERQSLARENSVPLSVCLSISFSKAKKTVSVFEPTVSNYSRLGRVMVVYNTKLDSWHCPCSRTGPSCPHIDVAKWHLFQEQPELFRTVPSKEDVDEIEIKPKLERLDTDEEGVTSP